MKLTGNTIFITGGGSGIGRGLAEALHKLGNQVIISGRRKSNLDATTQVHPGMRSVELDIADSTNIGTVTKELIADYPALKRADQQRRSYADRQCRGRGRRPAADIDGHNQPAGPSPRDVSVD